MMLLSSGGSGVDAPDYALIWAVARMSSALPFSRPSAREAENLMLQLKA